MKYSKQRNLILKTVLENPIHPTAEQVYSAVKESCANISLGTVYRNLNLLCEIGQLIKIPVSDGSDRFDGRVDKHFHMICGQCGNVFDLEVPKETDIEKYIKDTSGFSVSTLDLTVRGFCKQCCDGQNE